MDDKIKWLLLAAGAYFLYDWLKGQGAVTTTGADAADAEAAAAKALAEAAALKASQTKSASDIAAALAARQAAERAAAIAAATRTKAPPGYVPATPAELAAAEAETLKAAASDQVATLAAVGHAPAITESNRRGMKFNYHQWNWYRAQALGEQPDPATFTSDPGAEVSVTQYLADLAGGLSGLGWAPRLPYSTAWSA